MREPVTSCCVWRKQKQFHPFFPPDSPSFLFTRRERLKSALDLRLKKRKVFKICSGRIYEKLRKQFRGTQTVPFMFNKIRKLLFLQLGRKNFFERIIRIFSVGKCIVPKIRRSSLCSQNVSFPVKVQGLR